MKEHDSEVEVPWSGQRTKAATHKDVRLADSADPSYLDDYVKIIFGSTPPLPKTYVSRLKGK